MTKRLRRKVAALLCGATMLAWGGTCLPENFWYNQWEGTLNTVAGTVVDAYVVTTITDFLVAE